MRHSSEEEEKMARTFVGTMMYMSPERLKGEDYSYASDIYSLGLVLLTVALGKFPVNMSDAG